MRVYEFAKKHGLSSKEIIDFLQSKDISVKSHASVLSDNNIGLLEQHFLHKGVGNSEKADKKNPMIDEHLTFSQDLSPLVLSDIDEDIEIESMPLGDAKTKKHALVKSAIKPKIFSEKRNFVQNRFQKHGKKEEPLPPVTSITLLPMTVGEFAETTRHQVGDVIVSLLKVGQACTKNHMLTVEQVEKLAQSYELEIIKPIIEKRDSANIQVKKTEQLEGIERAPVVVVMGHVDHGKTTLLDYIRTSRVAAKEKGGITQHLGAYEVKASQGNITFLDTPGHAAFSKIRQRGASVADIAILVVAADDGIMPQTVESIKAIQAMAVPVIVAINKIDKTDAARLEVIKRQLAQYDLVPEEWGGSVICVPVSAKVGTGIPQLLELIILQAQMMELKGNTAISAQGYILESKTEKGRGFVATVLCRQGTLRIGDFFKVGSVHGKVISLVDSYGKNCKEVGPSIPVLVSGFDDMPAVGELFTVINEQDYRKDRGVIRQSQALSNSRISASVQKEQVPLIIKADTHSSLEAILDGIEKISKTSDKSFLIVHSGIGQIIEYDTILGETTGAIVVGFTVKIDTAAAQYARAAKVTVLSYDIIYKLFEDLQMRATKAKVAEMKEVKIGEAVVLKIFDIKGLGVIAGCYIREGRFNEKGVVIVKRGRKEVGKGKMKSLQRDKKTVKEVHTGFECAFLVDGFDEWHVDDLVECYLKVPVAS